MIIIPNHKVPSISNNEQSTAFTPNSGELTDALKNVQNIIEIKPLDANFFLTITENTIYQKNLENLTFQQKKLVNITLLEIGENVLRHWLKDGKDINIFFNSRIAVSKTNEEVEIVTENLFDVTKINSTAGGIDTFLDRINAINEKSLDDLKNDHAEEIQNTGLNVNGWGNLGFISIAKKIKKMYQESFNKPLNNIFKARIVPINDQIAKLILIVKIPLSKSPVLQ